MLLGGVEVEDRLIRELAGIVERPLGSKLERALFFRAKVMGLTGDERQAVLAALETAPDELQNIRDLLLTNDRWRRRQPLW